MRKCWQHHIVNHLSIMRKPDLCKKKGWQFKGCLPVYHMQLDEEFGTMLPFCVLNNLQPFQPQCLHTILIRYKTIMSTTFIRCTFLKKTSFPSPLPEQNPNDNFILWKPSFPTTQQEHAAAQISMAVKMGDAFWYATWWYTDWENQRTSDPKLHVDPNVQGIMILLDILCMRKFKGDGHEEHMSLLVGVLLQYLTISKFELQTTSQIFCGKWPPWK